MTQKGPSYTSSAAIYPEKTKSVSSTYLVFIAGSAFEIAIKVATARACGRTEGTSWSRTLREIKAALERV